jgi:hypothetical protein
MPLEDMTGTSKFIDALDPLSPDGSEFKNVGDDHIRGIKNILFNCFEFITGKITATHTELNYLSGLVIGTVSSGKAVTADGNKDILGARLVSATGAPTAAEHLTRKDYVDTYASSTVGGRVKMRVSGTSLYITNDGSTA